MTNDRLEGSHTMYENGTVALNLEREITSVLNRYSAENGSNTPDFILARYLLACLAAFDAATDQRRVWYYGDAGAATPAFGSEDGPSSPPLPRSAQE